MNEREAADHFFGGPSEAAGHLKFEQCEGVGALVRGGFQLMDYDHTYVKIVKGTLW